MESTMKQSDAAQRQLGELEGQLRMFAKIKDLYNSDIVLEIK